MSAAQRLRWIDFTRGVIMCLMAWDHVAGFWWPQHYGGEGLGGAFPYLGADLLPFMLRFVTHFCAPTFFLLSGASLAISAARRLGRGESQRSVSLHLVKRAGVLFLLMIFIEGNAFGMSPLYFGVLGCFGACFLVFSLLRRLPWKAMLAASLAIVVLHPLLDLSFIPGDGDGRIWRMLIHEPNTANYYPFQVLYPVIPWIGVMGLGWCLGTYLDKLEPDRIRRLATPFAAGGVFLLAAFLGIRWLNGYGNLVSRQGDSVQAWLAVSKYPPDLAFLTVTLGGALLLMALGLTLEERGGFDAGWTGVLLVFGRNALFFYVTHLVLYRVRPFFMTRPLFSMGLPTVALFWVLGLLVLWRLCLRYEKYKRAHPGSLLQYV